MLFISYIGIFLKKHSTYRVKGYNFSVNYDCKVKFLFSPPQSQKVKLNSWEADKFSFQLRHLRNKSIKR